MTQMRACGAICKSQGKQVQVMMTSTNLMVRTVSGKTERLRNFPRKRPVAGKVSPRTVANGYLYNLLHHKK